MYVGKEDPTQKETDLIRMLVTFQGRIWGEVPGVPEPPPKPHLKKKKSRKIK